MGQSSVTLILIIAAICLTIGYTAGWLISSATRSKEDEKEAGEEKSLLVRAVLPSRQDVPPGNPTGSYHSILRLWREDKGRLLVEFDGKSLVTSGTLLPEQRKRLDAVLHDAANWLGLVPSSAAQPPLVSPPVIPLPQSTSVDLDNIRAIVEPVALVNKPPSVIDGMTTAVANVIQPLPAAKREVSKSIVGQIDEVLHELLAISPLAGQKIYLFEDLRQGVIVWVGTQSFVGIDAVPAGEVKDLLKRAVAEWERRQETRRG